MYLAKKSEGIILLENEQLKQDLGRLLNLLKCTAEFKDFIEYSYDSKGMTFLKDFKRYSKYDLPSAKQARLKCLRTDEPLIDE